MSVHYSKDELNFAWNREKATDNLWKHGVSFTEAASVFSDGDGVLLDDPEHSDDEDRFVLLGLSERLRIVVVSHALHRDDETIRIISARKATKHERDNYFRRMML